MRGHAGFHRHTAAEIVQNLGERLIGKRVVTQPMGDWPGGIARVTEIFPDPNAPEIVFIVHGESENNGYEMGVFDYEPCVVLSD